MSNKNRKKINLILIIMIVTTLILSIYTYTAPKKAKTPPVEQKVIDKIPEEEIIYEEDNFIKVENSPKIENRYYRGMLHISNTDYYEPLYQTRDNDYFLTHDPLDNYKSSGSVYLDYRVNIKDSKKILIFGHNNNKLNLPFSILENYNDQDYYKRHQFLELSYDEEMKKYQIFSVYIETKDWDYMNLKFTNNTWVKHLEKLKNKSFYDTSVSVDENDEILILQTCSHHENYKNYKNKYMLVIAKRVK